MDFMIAIPDNITKDLVSEENVVLCQFGSEAPSTKINFGTKKVNIGLQKYKADIFSISPSSEWILTYLHGR